MTDLDMQDIEEELDSLDSEIEAKKEEVRCRTAQRPPGVLPGY